MKFIFVPLLLLLIGAKFEAYPKKTVKESTDSTAHVETEEVDSTYKELIVSSITASGIYQWKGQYDSSLLVLNACFDDLPRVPKSKEEIRLIGYLHASRAYTYAEGFGDFLSAKKEYLEALNNFEAINNTSDYVARYVYQPLGNIYTRLGENEQAIRLLKEFKRIAILLEKDEYIVQAHNDIGRAYMNKGDYEIARNYLVEGIDQFPGDFYNVGLLYSSLAETEMLNGHIDAGIQAANNSIHYFEKARKEDGPEINLDKVEEYMIGTYNVLGALLTKANREDEAEVFLKRALVSAQPRYPIKHRKIAKIFCALGDNNLASHDFESAYGYFHKALITATPKFSTQNPDSLPKSEELIPEVTIGEALLGKAQAAFKLGESLADNEWRIKALKIYLCYFEWENKLRSEQFDFYSKLHFSSEIHKAGEEALEVIYSLQNGSNEEGLAEIALNIIHQSNGVILSESNARLLSGDKSVQRWTHELRVLAMQLSFFKTDLEVAKRDSNSTEINRLEKAITSLDRQLQLAEFEIRKKYQGYDQLIASNELPKKELFTYLEKLKSNLINYFQGKNFTYIIAVNDAKCFFERVETTAVEEDCSALRLALKNPKSANAKDYQELALKSFNTLIQPVKKYLMKNCWIIIPDGIINTIPIEALVSKAESNPSFKNLNYVLLDHTIHYTPAIQKLLISNSKSKLKNFLGVAPDFSKKGGFPNLQFSTEEINYGASFWNGDTWSNSKATKKNFLKMSEEYRVLHISTHAGLDTLPVSNSWLAFSDHNTKERLIGTELLQLQLNSDLVILNACETGNGEYYDGEGILSLSRSFMDAGSRNVLTNLWSVNHASSFRILQNFYDALKNTNSPSNALRQAKLDFLQSGETDDLQAHPYFWSPMILMGNNQQVHLSNDENTSPLQWIVVLTIIVLTISIIYIKMKYLN